MIMLGKLLKGYRPVILFPALGILVGIIPVLLFISTWGGSIRVVEEWLPLYAMYVPVGVLFGTGYVLLKRRQDA